MGKKSKPRIVAQVAEIRTEMSASYSGPLPRAEQLERYNQVLPGAADRIISMAEDNAKHRRSLEHLVVAGGVKAQVRGQWFAFILAVIVMGLGCWLVATDRESLGFWLMLTDIIGLAAVFVIGRVLESRERKEKRRELKQG